MQTPSRCSTGSERRKVLSGNDKEVRGIAGTIAAQQQSGKRSSRLFPTTGDAGRTDVASPGCYVVTPAAAPPCKRKNRRKLASSIRRCTAPVLHDAWAGLHAGSPDRTAKRGKAGQDDRSARPGGTFNTGALPRIQRLRSWRPSPRLRGIRQSHRWHAAHSGEPVPESPEQHHAGGSIE